MTFFFRKENIFGQQGAAPPSKFDRPGTPMSKLQVKMQGHFCFIKCLIFERLPEVDVSAICWIFDEACSCGSYIFSGTA